MMSRIKSRPGSAAVSFVIKFPAFITLPMWRTPRRPPRLERVASNLSDPPVGSHRFGDGFERGHRGEHLTRRDRIWCAPGDGVGKGFEVDADRVDRREAQMLGLDAALPQHEFGAAECFRRGVAAECVDS